MSDYEDDDITEGAFERATAATPEAAWNAQCNSTFRDGVKRFGGAFEEAVEQLKAEGIATPDVLLQIHNTNDPAKTLYDLAQDKEIAKTVAKLNPVQRVDALAAIQRGDPLPTYDSTPDHKKSRRDLSNESLSSREWSREFDRQYRNGLPGMGGRRGR